MDAPQRPRRLRRWAAVPCLVGLAVTAWTFVPAGTFPAWFSSTSSPSHPTSATKTVHPTVGSAGMRVAIDPETGELVPATGAQAAKLSSEMQEMLSRSSDGLVVQRHADGHQSVDLQGRFMNLSVARIDEDGKLQTNCVTSEQEAEAFLNGQTPPASPARTPEVR